MEFTTSSRTHWSSKFMSVLTIAALVMWAFGPVALLTPTTALANQNHNDDDDNQVAICHVTGSQDNPWNAIHVSQNALATHLGHGDFLYNGPEDLSNSWCAAHVPVPTTATIVATKIVCDSEVDLPNLQGSSHGTGSTTATTFIAAHPNCHVQSGWQFEWGNQSATDPGRDFVGTAPTGYTTSGVTAANGTVSMTVPLAGISSIHVREVLQNGYIPFTYDQTHQSNANTVSAEISCSNDGLNYDNFDFVNSPLANHTYYCVAWNVAKPGTLTVVKYVTNNYNGSAVAGDFTLHVSTSTDGASFAGSEQGTIVHVPGNGVYSVTEDATSTYTSSFSDGCSGTMVPGGTASCTVTNDDKPATLHVVKVLHNDGGGTKQVQDFSFSVDEGQAQSFTEEGENDVTVSAGSHSVTETPDAHYVTSYDHCSNIQVTNGDEATCTITNTYIPPAPECNENAETVVVSDATTQNNSATSTVVINGADLNPGIFPPGVWAGISGASWIWNGDYMTDDTTQNKTEVFTKSFSIAGIPTSASLDLSADNGYIVKVNGTQIDDQSAVETNYTSVHHYDISSNVHTGSNTLEVIVINFHLDNSSFANNPGGLIYKIDVHANECTQQATCTPGVNLLQNPSFEAPVVTDNSGTWQLFGNGTPLLNWMVRYVSGNPSPLLEIQRHYSSWSASDGDQFAELDSNESSSIYQDIPTVPGKTYTVGFDFAARPDASSLADNNMLVSWGGSSVVSTSTDLVSSGPNTRWIHNSYDVVATSSTTRVEFTDLGTSNSLGSFVDTTSVMCKADVPPPSTATVVATKIVCDNESDLPNWGAGHGPDIGQNTAADFLEEHHNCHLQSGWQFQWAPNGSHNPGDNTAAAGTPWTTTDPTDTNGVVTVHIPAAEGLTWFREVMQDGFVHFSSWLSNGENSPSTQDAISAEMYCNTDHLNYDNFDWINNPQADHTYYCVAFNAPTAQTHTDTSADVSVLKTVNHQSPTVGSTVTYTITVTNNSSTNTATGVAVTDTLPSGLTWISDDSNGAYATTTTHVWTVGTLAPSAVATLHITATVTSAALITNTATVTSNNDTNSENNNSDASFTSTVSDDDGCTEGCGGDGGGGGGGGGTDTSIPPPGNGPISNFSFGGNGPTAPGGQVLGASCGLYMNKFIRLGKRNDSEQVKKLQIFLNKWMNANIPVTGFYGPLTYSWVQKFQQKYGDDILKPWGINSPTGIVYQTTLWRINKTECSDLLEGVPSLIEWSKNNNVPN